MPLEGIVRLDRMTKRLARRLQPEDIAVIAHRDLDEVAANSLLRARVKAVINAYSSISGRYPNRGPEKLLQARIPIIDNVGEDVFNQLREGDRITIRGSYIYRGKKLIARGEFLDATTVHQRLEQGRANLVREMDQFVNNTLIYAAREKEVFLGKIPVPELPVKIKGKHVLVVARGHNYREDLAAIRSYIAEKKPVLIGVDGGGDALLELGYTPHIIIGDMDSVSDRVLACGAVLVVHAYKNGHAPGLARIRKLKLPALLFPVPGTSEDAALLLAYEQGAELIVAVGLHSNLIDFLEKGRQGMASTLLVRLKVGPILVDARGVSQLYRGSLKLSYLGCVFLAGLFPFLVTVLASTRIQYFLQLMLLKIRLLVGL
ncbi:MAG TPA: hypothetical protein GX518_02990 [Firmicutes bacterium]|nr:hypothetical protein [Bacillota bacterium]